MKKAFLLLAFLVAGVTSSFAKCYLVCTGTSVWVVSTGTDGHTNGSQKLEGYSCSGLWAVEINCLQQSITPNGSEFDHVMEQNLNAHFDGSPYSTAVPQEVSDNFYAATANGPVPHSYVYAGALRSDIARFLMTH